MILLEEHIELRIYHFKELRKYDVIEVFRDDEGISFKILYNGAYFFTLIPKNSGTLSFGLSQLDKDLDTAIDHELCSKIQAALYSVFLKEIPS